MRLLLLSVHSLKYNNLQRFCRRVLENISGLRGSTITLHIRSHPFLYPKQKTLSLPPQFLSRCLLKSCCQYIDTYFHMWAYECICVGGILGFILWTANVWVGSRSLGRCGAGHKLDVNSFNSDWWTWDYIAVICYINMWFIYISQYVRVWQT